MSFQFHNGTINTECIRRICSIVLGFNSTTVQLIQYVILHFETSEQVSIPQRYN